MVWDFRRSPAYARSVGSLFFAFTLGGAFWVGVLAARRMRDWGDTGRMLEANLDHGPERLPAAQAQAHHQPQPQQPPAALAVGVTVVG